MNTRPFRRRLVDREEVVAFELENAGVVLLDRKIKARGRLRRNVTIFFESGFNFTPLNGSDSTSARSSSMGRTMVKNDFPSDVSIAASTFLSSEGIDVFGASRDHVAAPKQRPHVGEAPFSNAFFSSGILQLVGITPRRNAAYLMAWGGP